MTPQAEQILGLVCLVLGLSILIGCAVALYWDNLNSEDGR